MISALGTWRRCVGAWVWVVVVGVGGVTYGQTAPDKNGARPSVLSLPSGPGSIEGLGKSFQPQLNTGAVTYPVALKLPAGPAGFAPKLTLVYNTGFGNGPLGRGWRLEGPVAIERQTVKGFPRYRDSERGGGRDVFVFEGEELVPLSNGTYRLENDESFRRFSPVAGREGGPIDAWLIEDRDGTRHWLGRHGGDAAGAVSRVVNPELEDRSPFERTFRWREDAAEDVNGNRIEYEYRTFADSPGVLYLERVTWRAADVTDARHEVELRTEPRADRLSDYRAGFEQGWGRRYREIAVGSHFDGSLHRVRAYELAYDAREGAVVVGDGNSRNIGLGVSELHAVTEFGSDRGWGGTGTRGTPLPPTRFAYTPMRLQPYGEAEVARLAALRHGVRPHERDPLVSGPVVRQLLQSTEGGATSPVFDTPLHDSRVELADVDGDGLVDILDTRLGPGRPRYTVARNLGGGVFQASRPVRRHPGGADLGQHTADAQTWLSDANGDGVVDLVQIIGRNAQRRTVIYENLASGAPGGEEGFSDEPVVRYGTPEFVDTTRPDVRQIDLNFDKVSDVLVSSERGLTGYIGSANGDWEPLVVANTAPGSYRFAADLPGGTRGPQPLVQLADLNGDRLLDLVRVYVREPGVAEVSYRPMTGPMSWGAEVALGFADGDGNRLSATARLRLPGIGIDRLDPANRWDAVRMLDANGDGLSDLVFVETGRSVRVYLNVHGDAFSGPYSVDGVPPYRPRDRDNPTLLRTADVNGNGSVDLVFYHRVGGPGLQGLWYVDFLGGQKPGLLRIADNGIGLRSYIRYKSAVVDQIAARESGAPWANVAPVSTWVVSGMVDDIGLDFNLDGESDRRVTTFRYRDPYYDGFEKQFRGFRFVQRVEWGDDIDPRTGLPRRAEAVPGHRTTVTRFGFHTGEPDGVDNDDYLDGFDTEPRAAVRVFDEWTPFGGREEEALKGTLFLQESVHPLALGDGAADFDACARRLALEPVLFAGSTPCTPDRYVYRREEHRWTIRRLYRPPAVVAPKGRRLQEEPFVIALGGMTVSFAHRVAVHTTLPEANGVLRDVFDHPDAPVAAAEPVVLKVEYEYDDFGNVTLERNWGVTAGRDPPLDDERVVRTTFARVLGADGRIDPWILDRPATRRVEDEQGAFVAEERRFYDGAPFVGLPLGQLGRRGLVSRREGRVHDPASAVPPLTWLPADVTQPLPGPGDPRVDAPKWIVQERVAYDASGNRIAAADGLARLAADGRLDPDSGHATLTTYDHVFRTFPVEERVRIGGGRPVLVFRAAYVSQETPYAAAVHWGHGVMTASWNPNGHRTDYLHDGHGRLTATRSPGDSDALPTVVFAYRPADPHRGLRYDYDRLGRLQPAGVPVRVPFDSAANLVVTDRRETAGEEGVVRSAAFTTGLGTEVLRLEEDAPGGYAVMKATRIGLRGTPVFEAHPYRQQTLEFRVPVLDAVGTELSSDPMDRVIRRLLPLEHDGPGAPRMETRVHHLPLSEWRFDEEDIASVDPVQNHRGTPLVLESDGLERLVGVTEHVRRSNGVEPWRTLYFHDLNDKLAGILDSQNNLRVMRHDGLGRRLALHDINRGLLRFVFDGADNVVETLDAKEHRITYRYDGANRLLSEDYHDAGQAFSAGRDYDPQQPLSEENRPDVLFTYDLPSGPVDLGGGLPVLPANTMGFLTGVSDLSGEEHVSYDARGRVAWHSKLLGASGAATAHRTAMTYDSADRLTGIEYPDGTRVAYHYNARGRTNRIDSDQLGIVLAARSYTAAGLPELTTYGNGVESSRDHDLRLRPRTITNFSPSERSTFMDYRYRYDGVSNVLVIQDRREATDGERFENSQSFAYDDLYRLTGAAYDTGHLVLAYDRTGNLTERRFVAADAATAETSMPGRIYHGGSRGVTGRIGRATNDPGPQAPTSAENGRSYSYDANGNLARRGDETLTWDFNDRLVGVEHPAFRAEYVYDYTGRRVTKRVWDGSPSRSGVAFETHYVSRYYHVVDGRTQRYVFDGGNRVARALDNGDLMFYHQDLVTSNGALTDASGSLIQSNAFMPFGGVRARHDRRQATADNGTPEYLFHQKERDQETELLYFEARYVDDVIGRFIRVDPALIESPREFLETPQVLNGYAFAVNNSLRYTDSSGKTPLLVVPAMYASITAYAVSRGFVIYYGVQTAKSAYNVYLDPSARNFTDLGWDALGLTVSAATLPVLSMKNLRLEWLANGIKFVGMKGAPGTGANYMSRRFALDLGHKSLTVHKIGPWSWPHGHIGGYYSLVPKHIPMEVAEGILRTGIVAGGLLQRIDGGTSPGKEFPFGVPMAPMSSKSLSPTK